MRLLLAFLVVLPFLSHVFCGPSRFRRDLLPFSDPVAVLRDNMFHFANAIRNRDQTLLLRVFSLGNVNDRAVQQVFNNYQGFRFAVRSASMYGRHRMQGLVSMIPEAAGGQVSNSRMMLSRNADSPTGWKIVSVRRV